MAVETRPELVGKRFLCVAAGEDARPERGQSGCGRGWRAGVIRAVSHRDRGHPDLAVRAGGRHAPLRGAGGQRSPGVRASGRAGGWARGRWGGRVRQGERRHDPDSVLCQANPSCAWLSSRKRWE